MPPRTAVEALPAVPRLVSAQACGKPLLAHHAQRDARQRRCNGRSCHTGQNLGKKGRPGPAPGEDHTASDQYHQHAGGHEATLVPGMVGEHAQRRHAEKLSQATGSHDEADLVRRPALTLKVDAEKRPQSVTNIGQGKTEQGKKHQGLLF